MMPEKFNNKTNGITQRRFLLHGNPLLAQWVTDHIGDELDHRPVPRSSKLTVYVDDREGAAGVHEHQVSEQGAPGKIHPESTTASTVDPRSIFDVQVKTICMSTSVSC